jgi:hypothetical protein
MALDFNGTDIWVYGAKRDNHGNYSGLSRFLNRLRSVTKEVVSLDGGEPVIQSGLKAKPETYQSLLYQATKLDPNSPHHIQVTNVPGMS